nr:MAG TPA: hypothetical protein [Caudoviricetes sp.]
MVAKEEFPPTPSLSFLALDRRMSWTVFIMKLKPLYR